MSYPIFKISDERIAKFTKDTEKFIIYDNLNQCELTMDEVKQRTHLNGIFVILFDVTGQYQIHSRFNKKTNDQFWSRKFYCEAPFNHDLRALVLRCFKSINVRVVQDKVEETINKYGKMSQVVLSLDYVNYYAIEGKTTNMTYETYAPSLHLNHVIASYPGTIGEFIECERPSRPDPTIIRL